MIKVDQMNRRIHTACLGIIFDVLCASLTVAQTTPVAGVQEKAIPLQSVSAIAVSPDGAHLAVSRYSPNGNETRTDIDNDSVEVWSLHSALAPQAFATNLHPIRNLAFSHNSQLLSAASQGFETILDEPPAAPQIFVGKVYLWHVADASEVKLSRPKIFWFYGNEGTYDEWSCTVAFSPDDKQVVADIFEVSRQPEYDVGTTFFDIKTGRAVNSTSLDTENSASPYWRRFSWLSPDGRRAFVLRRNRPVLVDTLNGRRVSGFAEFPLYFNPSDQDACDLGVHAFGLAAFQPDMRRVALANDSQLEIRDAMTGAIKTQTALKQTNNASRESRRRF